MTNQAYLFGYQEQGTVVSYFLTLDSGKQVEGGCRDDLSDLVNWAKGNNISLHVPTEDLLARVQRIYAPPKNIVRIDSKNS